MPKLGQDVVEELLRDRVGLGDLGNLGERARLEAGEMHHGLDAVFALVRQHIILGLGAGLESRKR
jgi:hypothetical protein